MTRTTRVGSKGGIGWSSGPHDDTDDVWTDVQSYSHSDGWVSFHLTRHVGRRVIGEYYFTTDDETFLLDLAYAALGGIAAIQEHEDNAERQAEMRTLETSSLDSDEDITRKTEARIHVYDKKRKKSKRRSQHAD